MFLLVVATAASAQTCAVSPGFNHPLMPDTDCDGVIDRYDNCPLVINPLQRDAEGSGLGDACDVYIESINTNPADFVYDGRAFNVYVTVHNNRDYNIRNMKVRVFLPELGIESVRYIANLEPCSSQTVEFFLRAPMCSPAYLKSIKTTGYTLNDIRDICGSSNSQSKCSKNTEQRLNQATPSEIEAFFASPADHLIVVENTFRNLYNIEEIIPGITSIRVMPDDVCMATLRNGQTMDDTFIDVMEIQDVFKGGESVFPIRISNREFNDKEYVFSVTGLDGWGSARFEPSSLIIVPSGSDRTMDLYVRANDDAVPGEKVFVVSVQNGEEVQRFLLIANVKESGRNNYGFLWFFTLKVILIIILILLIIAAAIVGIKKYFDSIKYNEGEAVQYY